MYRVERADSSRGGGLGHAPVKNDLSPALPSISSLLAVFGDIFAADSRAMWIFPGARICHCGKIRGYTIDRMGPWGPHEVPWGPHGVPMRSPWGPHGVSKSYFHRLLIRCGAPLNPMTMTT